MTKPMVTLSYALAAVLVLFAPIHAQAGQGHSIQTANSPSTGAPIAGGGTWIVNRADAYYIGRLLPGSTFDNEYTDGNNWHYGRAYANINMCGWAMPGSMGASTGALADSCSDAVKSQLSHRRYVGRDYNAPAHAAVDGTGVPANTACGLYYNYFYGTDFTSNYGHPADFAGSLSGTVYYRFTTNDGAMVVVRDPVLGWGFASISCVQRPAQLYNDDD
ncbi:MAG: hypothetical protein WCB04_07825 [Mycobacteriales bacterium]